MYLIVKPAKHVDSALPVGVHVLRHLQSQIG